MAEARAGRAGPIQRISDYVIRAAANPVRLFVGVLAGLLVLMMAVENWPLVRFSLVGISFDLPGTILYLIFIILGMVVFWVLSWRRESA